MRPGYHGVAVSLADDAPHWRARAAEARAMLNIAESYERIATRAEQRQTTKIETPQ